MSYSKTSCNYKWFYRPNSSNKSEPKFNKGIFYQYYEKYKQKGKKQRRNFNKKNEISKASQKNIQHTHHI